MTTRVIRVLLIIVGVLAIANGVALIWDFSRSDQVSIVLWLALGLIAHDAILAPVALGVAWLVRRVLPPDWWKPVLLALAYTNILLLLALPVILPRPAGQYPDNPTVLDRNYGLGLMVAIIAVWVGVFAVMVLPRRLGRSRPQA
ncbi:hypothetical protein [Gordonia rhizosphera]|uniref:Uncharacterized protein n=1 Tax=Gordonia rhizosphera NBRC 16068 TaxID=1108045 RepID=K6WC71_9ACTN|nr:hypothetical protein [Gordonia rhizosphera]GAB91306.1 hypothetical protein GORHZ_126_00470 [Gordonia rhizosphera NBRC 16068]